MADREALPLGLRRGRAAGPGRGLDRRPPPGRLPPLARRAPARARTGALARPVHVPTRELPACELRRLALRPASVAALRRVRRGRRVEPLPAPELRRGRGLRLPLVTRAAASTRGRARGRAGVRARALPRGPERGPLPRADLDPVTARAVRVRTLPARKPLVARAFGRRPRVDPVLRPAPVARGDPVLPPLRGLQDERRARARGRGAGRGAGRRRGLPRRRPVGSGLDRLGRAVAARGRALLGGGPRPHHAPQPARARELRLSRLAHAAARGHGSRAPRARPADRARRRAGRRRRRPDPALARDALPALLAALAPLPAAAVSARAGAADAGGVPRARRARRGHGGRDRARTPALGDARLRARDRGAVRRPARERLPARARGSGERGLHGASLGAAGSVAGAADGPPERPPRQRLPLLRHAGPAAAARRVLDGRAEEGGHDRPRAGVAELRRLAPRATRLCCGGSASATSRSTTASSRAAATGSPGASSPGAAGGRSRAAAGSRCSRAAERPVPRPRASRASDSCSARSGSTARRATSTARSGHAAPGG